MDSHCDRQRPPLLGSSGYMRIAAVTDRRRQQRGFRCFVITLCFHLSSAPCSDGDKGCLERGCSQWCSIWTCAKEGCQGCGPDIGCPDKPPPPPSPPPLPALPPWDRHVHQGMLNIYAGDGFLWVNGERLHIKGVNWFGSEGRAGPPLGLDQHKIEWYMRFLVEHKFNAIRFLFNHECVLNDAKLEPPNEAVYGVGAPWEAPELAHMRYLEMFVKLAEVAARYGVLILMACHRLSPESWPGKGLWYDESISEVLVKESWNKIAAHLCRQWNVMGVDLQNEPHSSSWAKGMGPGSDWGHAAERIGNHVLTRCPRWMIFVEGVGYSPGAPDMDNGGDGIWWGENLHGVIRQPVKLSDPSKLVYSPHTYGPSVYEQKYFSDPNFPRNMPAIWDKRFAFVQQKTGTPIVVGEMGGFYTGKDKIWQDWAFAFMRHRGMGVFYFALNPGSDDTGGLIMSDWNTPEMEKLVMLSQLPSTDILEARRVSLALEEAPRTPPPPLAPPPAKPVDSPPPPFWPAPSPEPPNPAWPSPLMPTPAPPVPSAPRKHRAPKHAQVDDSEDYVYDDDGDGHLHSNAEAMQTPSVPHTTKDSTVEAPKSLAHTATVSPSDTGLTSRMMVYPLLGASFGLLSIAAWCFVSSWTGTLERARRNKMGELVRGYDDDDDDDDEYDSDQHSDDDNDDDDGDQQGQRKCRQSNDFAASEDTFMGFRKGRPR